MNKKKIVHLISSLKIGGAESWLVDLANHLPREKFEQHVIFFHDGPNKKNIERLHFLKQLSINDFVIFSIGYIHTNNMYLHKCKKFYIFSYKTIL